MMAGKLFVCVAIATALAAISYGAPPFTGRVTPIDPTKTRVAPTRPFKIDPALIDVPMSFDFRHAVFNNQTSSASLPFPGPPTEKTQGAILTLFARGIVWPVKGDGMSAVRMVFTATNKPATADFRSNAFELSKRRAITLDWSGNFEPMNFPIEIRISFGQDQTIGSVLFDKGNVLVGPIGLEKAIGTYVAANPGAGILHRLSIRADLVARNFTVRFEQNGSQVISAPVPFPAGTAVIPAGQQQVTARLTSPQPYVSGYYDLSRLSLNGEAK